MRRRLLQHALAWLGALSLCLLSLPARAQAPSAADETPAARDRQFDELAAEVALLERQMSVLKRVIQLVQPTVVHIESKRDETDSRQRRATIEEAGSGVIVQWQSQHYVLTNRHVVRDARLENILVKLHDGREIHPGKVWSDQASDVAVMTISAPGLVAARVGDSNRLEIGDLVLAVGSPFGLSHSVTHGIISAKGRRDLELGSQGVLLQDFLQTDAAINPGNSGGPLLNLRGEVVGINTAIASNSGASEGVGFAIPINMAVLIARRLIEHGNVVRAFLGVQLDSRFSAEAAMRIGLARPEGARVSGVTRGSPAEAAKIQVGDVILQFDGQRVEDDNHLVTLVSLTDVGKEVNLLLFREGRTQSLRVAVGARDGQEP